MTSRSDVIWWGDRLAGGARCDLSPPISGGRGTEIDRSRLDVVPGSARHDWQQVDGFTRRVAVRCEAGSLGVSERRPSIAVPDRALLEAI